MVYRCTRPNHASFKNYGARGIKVCDRWLDSFASFVKDMGEPPTEKHTLDRINNDGPYSPENCRWASRYIQTRNKRNNVILEYDGKRMCLMDWANYLGIKHETLAARIRVYGWSVERALSESFDATRLCRMITFGGKTLPITYWETETGISTKTIRRRLAQGWTVDEALTVKPLVMGPKPKHR